MDQRNFHRRFVQWPSGSKVAARGTDLFGVFAKILGNQELTLLPAYELLRNRIVFSLLIAPNNVSKITS